MTSKTGKLLLRFDLVDPTAMLKLAGVLYHGIERGYQPDSWRGVDVACHINHMLAHIYAYLAGDRQEDHLAHAFCRLMFIVALEAQDGSV